MQFAAQCAQSDNNTKDNNSKSCDQHRRQGSLVQAGELGQGTTGSLTGVVSGCALATSGSCSRVTFLGGFKNV